VLHAIIAASVLAGCVTASLPEDTSPNLSDGTVLEEMDSDVESLISSISEAARTMEEWDVQRQMFAPGTPEREQYDKIVAAIAAMTIEKIRDGYAPEWTPSVGAISTVTTVGGGGGLLAAVAGWFRERRGRLGNVSAMEELATAIVEGEHHEGLLASDKISSARARQLVKRIAETHDGESTQKN